MTGRRYPDLHHTSARWGDRLVRVAGWVGLTFGLLALLGGSAGVGVVLGGGALLVLAWARRRRRTPPPEPRLPTSEPDAALVDAWKRGDPLRGAADDAVLLELPVTVYRRQRLTGAVRRQGVGTVSVLRKKLRLDLEVQHRELGVRTLRRISAKRDAVELVVSNGPHWVIATDRPRLLAVAIGQMMATFAGATLQTEER